MYSGSFVGCAPRQGCNKHPTRQSEGVSNYYVFTFANSFLTVEPFFIICYRSAQTRRIQLSRVKSPYGDGFMIAAQVLCIVAFAISWIWWVVWIISFAAVIFFNSIWCCRQSKAGIIAATSIATIAGALCVVAAFIMLVNWQKASLCAPFYFWSDADYYDDIYDNNSYDDANYYDISSIDLCPEVAYATVAFIDATLWFAVAACTFTFLKSGRYARIEAALVEKSRTGNGGGAVMTVVEMGNVQTVEQVAEDPVRFASATTTVSASFPANYALIPSK